MNLSILAMLELAVFFGWNTKMRPVAWCR